MGRNDQRVVEERLVEIGEVQPVFMRLARRFGSSQTIFITFIVATIYTSVKGNM
jgi:hypothetical protein